MDATGSGGSARPSWTKMGGRAHRPAPMFLIGVFTDESARPSCTKQADGPARLTSVRQGFFFTACSFFESPALRIPLIGGIHKAEPLLLSGIACAERVPSFRASRSTGAPSENDGVNRTDESFPGHIKKQRPQRGGVAFL